MNRTPEQLEADNNEVRSRMDSTLDELEHRLDAREVLRSGVDRLRETDAVRYTTAAAVIAGRVARDYPLPTALAGVGLLGLIAWGMRGARPRSHRAYRSRTYDANHAIGTAKAHLQNARRMLAESTSDVRERAADAGGRAWHHMEHAGSAARSSVERHPVAAGTVGLALLAVAAAAAMPSVRARIKGD